ncbi:hypothetical protein BOH71_02405 [Bacillus subtilis]|nr:hypothetical protein BOH71_02405 [Bacillus subtilis]QAW07016.1 hypothetical protein ETA15_01960 [Bacillus subtilis]
MFLFDVFFFVKYFTFILCNTSQTFAREKFCLIYEQKRNHHRWFLRLSRKSRQPLFFLKISILL